MKLFFVLATATMICLVNIPSLLKEKKWKDISVFSGFLLLGIILGTIFVFRLPFPNPTNIIEDFYKPVTDALEAMIKVYE